MLVDPILVKFLIAQITYGPLKYLKNFRGLRPLPPPGALAPGPKFELHIAISPGQVRCTSTFFATIRLLASVSAVQVLLRDVV